METNEALSIAYQAARLAPLSGDNHDKVKEAQYIKSLSVDEIVTLLSSLNSTWQDNVHTFLNNDHRSKNTARINVIDTEKTSLTNINNSSDPLMYLS